jgi:hypothetical protein
VAKSNGHLVETEKAARQLHFELEHGNASLKKALDEVRKELIDERFRLIETQKTLDARMSFQAWWDGFSGASANCLSASAFILFRLTAGDGINGLAMGSVDSFTNQATNLFRRATIALVTRCSFCIRTEWIPARSPRPLYGSPAPVKVVR